jgi:hypothetical protein
MVLCMTRSQIRSNARLTVTEKTLDICRSVFMFVTIIFHRLFLTLAELMRLINRKHLDKNTFSDAVGE